MFKIINYSIISLLILIPMNLFAQSNADSSNSLSNSDNSKLELRLNPYLQIHKIFLGQKDYSIPETNFLSQQRIYASENPEQTISQLKLKIKDYLGKRRNLLPNYNLGEFGTYLGYANTLAVVILAIAHISKYGFK